jgi:hypothetical protein
MEFAVAVERNEGHGAILYPRERWMCDFQGVEEGVDGGVGSFDFGEQPGGIVAHISREVQTLGQIVNEWAEANALYDSPQADLNALWHTSGKN